MYDSNTVIYLPAGSIPFAVSAATLALGISSIGFSSTGSFGMESERDVKVKGYEIRHEIKIKIIFIENLTWLILPGSQVM